MTTSVQLDLQRLLQRWRGGNGCQRQHHGMYAKCDHLYRLQQRAGRVWRICRDRPQYNASPLICPITENFISFSQASSGYLGAESSWRGRRHSHTDCGGECDNARRFNRCRIRAGAADFADAGHGAVGPGPGAALAESPRCPLRVPDSVTLVSLPPIRGTLIRYGSSQWRALGSICASTD